MIRVGLTGSIAMGKSTTADMFRTAGVPVHDADEAVHRLYQKGGAAVEPMRGLAPDAIRDGSVSRDILKRLIAADPSLLPRIEKIVHPLVLADRKAFERRARAAEKRVIVFDVPLLFETGADRDVDVVIVVSTSAEIQRDRALSRPGMTARHFEAILAKQTPDSEKRARADFVIDTSNGLEDAQAQVSAIIEKLEARAADNAGNLS